MSKVTKWQGGKRLQTQTLQIASDTTCIRSLDWDRDRFDIEFALEIGTTYNSYLIVGPQGTALVDSSHEKFRGPYLDALRAAMAAAGAAALDFVVVSHTEPDHSGLIKDLVEMFPELVVVGSKVSINFLKNLMRTDFNGRAVKGGDSIDLGGGHALQFVPAPNLHWPDSMFTFDPATNVMYTCDAFGSHYCTEDPWDTDIEALLPHYRFYYDCLMKPNSRSVTTALRKVKDLPFEVIANGHGPMLRHNMTELVGDYGTWSAAVGKSDTSVAVLYSDNYGYCDRLSQALARGVTKANVATEMIDLASVDHAELRAALGSASGVVIMCPAAGAAAEKEALNVAFSELSPKKHRGVIIAESYGGDDEPVDGLTADLVALGLEPSAALRVREAPGEQTYQEYEEAGTDLAQALGRKAAIARARGMEPAVAKALGKLSSGLYIITAAHPGVRSAMVASWVAQASFEPLGLTVAVAKDRAIESLMQVGDAFVLNVLGEGRSAPLMKHFLKRFPPGADRFEGVDMQLNAAGCPVLAGAIANLDCKVVSRLETNDHWITYCEVLDGVVAEASLKTEVHRRKVANYY